MRSEGLGFQTVWVFLLNISTFLDGSEGREAGKYPILLLYFSMLSYGSEGVMISSISMVMLYISMLSYGSEGQLCQFNA